jgi:hypothetical protein
MCCIANDKSCFNCIYNKNCIYGSVFESIVSKDNQVLAGRDRIAHPIIIETAPFAKMSTSSLVLTIIFIGSSIASAPYFFQALKKGGESGVLRQRTPYTISDVIEYSPRGRRSLLVNADTLNTQIEPDIWEFDNYTSQSFNGQVMVQISSPLRFKVQGRYTSTFTASDFAFCLHRRTWTLCSQYGCINYTEGADSAGTDYQFSRGWTIAEKALKWQEWDHYSARQKRSMQLGGVTGSMVLTGDFTAYEYALLDFAAIFHAGKNTNFGLGKLSLNS